MTNLQLMTLLAAQEPMEPVLLTLGAMWGEPILVQVLLIAGQRVQVLQGHTIAAPPVRALPPEETSDAV